MSLKVVKRKAAKEQLKCSPTAINILFLLMLHIVMGMLKINFILLSFIGAEKIAFYPKRFRQTDIQSDTDRQTFQIIE